MAKKLRANSARTCEVVSAMPVLWLPFYDFGGDVGKSLATPADAQLFQFLSQKALQALPTRGRHAPPVAAPKNDGGKFLDFLLKALAPFGCPQPGPDVVPGPSSGRHGAIVRTLNRLFAEKSPAEYRGPNFGEVLTSGQLLASDLPYQFSSIESMRSAWTGLTASSKGPKLELPFHDVSTPVQLQVNQNQEGPSGVPVTPDQILVSSLMKMVGVGLPDMLPGVNVSPNSIVTLGAIPVFGARAKECGWPVDDINCVSPAGNNRTAPSLIRPLNYYAALSRPHQFSRLSREAWAWAPATLVQALAANAKFQG